MRIGMVAIGLLLGSCGTVVDIVSSISPQSAPQAPAPDPEPAYKQLISANIAQIFPDSSSLRNVLISAVRRTQLLEGPGWRACLKADVKNMNGAYIAAQTYVIAIRHNQIADRRRAAPEDGCDTEVFERLPF